jgi:hypothetical protein
MKAGDLVRTKYWSENYVAIVIAIDLEYDVCIVLTCEGKRVALMRPSVEVIKC